MTNEQPLSDEAIDKIRTWPAAFDKGTWKQIDSTCQEPCHGVHRRILLGMLMKNSDELIKAAEDDPALLFQALKYGAATIAMYKRLVKLLDSAHWRLTIALAGVDMDAPGAPFSQEEYLHAIEVAEGKDDDDLN